MMEYAEDNSCEDMEAPCRDIRYLINNEVLEDNDEIILLEGVYRGVNNTNISFNELANITIRGIDDAAKELIVLDCSIDREELEEDNDLSCLEFHTNEKFIGNITLNGFTITLGSSLNKIVNLRYRYEPEDGSYEEYAEQIYFKNMLFENITVGEVGDGHGELVFIETDLPIKIKGTTFNNITEEVDSIQSVLFISSPNLIQFKECVVREVNSTNFIFYEDQLNSNYSPYDVEFEKNSFDTVVLEKAFTFTQGHNIEVNNATIYGCTFESFFLFDNFQDQKFVKIEEVNVTSSQIHQSFIDLNMEHDSTVEIINVQSSKNIGKGVFIKAMNSNSKLNVTDIDINASTNIGVEAFIDNGKVYIEKSSFYRMYNNPIHVKHQQATSTGLDHEDLLFNTTVIIDDCYFDTTLNNYIDFSVDQILDENDIATSIDTQYYVYNVTNSVFNSNYDSFHIKGSVTSSPTDDFELDINFDNCTFSNNKKNPCISFTSISSSSLVDDGFNVNMTVTNSTFYNNSANITSGIYIDYNQNLDLSIDNTTSFINNVGTDSSIVYCNNDNADNGSVIDIHINNFTLNHDLVHDNTPANQLGNLESNCNFFFAPPPLEEDDYSTIDQTSGYTNSIPDETSGYYGDTDSIPDYTSGHYGDTDSIPDETSGYYGDTDSIPDDTDSFNFEPSDTVDDDNPNDNSNDSNPNDPNSSDSSPDSVSSIYFYGLLALGVVFIVLGISFKGVLFFMNKNKQSNGYSTLVSVDDIDDHDT
eukprot:TRINITY_DN714_c1_g1_i4.p1 TRINITY_DN714_c1_g1~~TRINITY_DN714_c1_g1_i4.p1  ORF type:complete len:757 (+),score=251.86 TRINITY_DN714_c1_g1_i4:2033-4303(+)